MIASVRPFMCAKNIGYSDVQNFHKPFIIFITRGNLL